MTVGRLKEILQNLPDEMEILSNEGPDHIYEEFNPSWDLGIPSYVRPYKFYYPGDEYDFAVEILEDWQQPVDDEHLDSIIFEFVEEMRTKLLLSF